MTKNKKSIAINLPKNLYLTLDNLARREKISIAAKATQLIKVALETLEDAIWEKIVSERDTPSVKYLTHEEFWREAMKED